MEIPPDLVRRLKRLRLGGLLPTLPDRATHARQAKLSPLEFLELLLQDEIDRRNSRGLQQRLATAGFEEEVTPETITWETPVSYDRPRVRELFGLHWAPSSNALPEALRPSRSAPPPPAGRVQPLRT